MAKVSELSGAHLALWVARALKLEEPRLEEDLVKKQPACVYVHHEEPGDDGWWTEFRPHEDWAQGGPIIEREGGSLFRCNENEPFWIASWWFEKDGLGRPLQFTGPTALVAAMRAYVASVYGAEVPDEVAP